MTPFFLKRTWLHRLAGILALPLAALSTENGTTAFANGAEDFLIAGMPPPGWYGLIYANRYDADELSDNTGNHALPDFHLTVSGIVPRLDWVKPISLLGSDRWGTLLVAPLLDLDLSLSPAPSVAIKARKRGLGDLTVGNGLHWTLGRFEMVNAVDVVLPIGRYDAADPVNPGQNRSVIRLNHMGTWHPTVAWDISYRLHWDYNFANPDTHYQSGQTLYLNWGIGWKPKPQMTVGLAGYFLRQITDDRLVGKIAGPDGNRVRVDGIGPCIKYFLPNHVMLTAKYFREFNVRNHPKGDQLWFYVAIPLSPPPR